MRRSRQPASSHRYPDRRDPGSGGGGSIPGLFQMGRDSTHTITPRISLSNVALAGRRLAAPPHNPRPSSIVGIRNATPCRWIWRRCTAVRGGDVPPHAVRQMPLHCPDGLRALAASDFPDLLPDHTSSEHHIRCRPSIPSIDPSTPRKTCRSEPTSRTVASVVSNRMDGRTDGRHQS